MNEKEIEFRTRKKILFEEAEAIEQKAKDENRDLTSEELDAITLRYTKMENVEKQIEVMLKLDATRQKLGEPANNTVVANKIEVITETDDFRNLGELLQAVARSRGHRGSYIAGIESGYIDKRLERKEYDARTILGANEQAPTDGGFLVRQDWANTLMQKTWETMVIAPRCKKFTISTISNGIKIPYVDETSRVNGSRWGGISSAWEGEGDSGTASNPKIGRMEMTLGKIMALAYMTDEILADSVFLSDLMMSSFPKEIGFRIDDAIVNGDGSAKPLGVLSNSNVLISVTKETSQDATTIVAENIIKMYSRMWPGSLGKAVWFANSNTFPQLATLGISIGTAGYPIWLPGNSIAGVPYNTLFGRPVVFIEQCQTLGAVGDIIFADMSEYLLIEKGGIKSASSIHVQFLTEQTAFRWSYRINGQSAWHTSVTPFKGSDTLSPFVALAVRE